MTKRDSNIAELLSPRQLRMEPYDVEMPMVVSNSYTTTNLATHNPTCHPHAASSHAAPANIHDHFRPLQLPHALQPGEYRQRIGHTTVFKIVQEAHARYIIVEETDSEGYMKRKSLEKYFFGIIGHLHGRYGQQLDSWTICSQLANYWRTWFNVPTEATFEPNEHTQTSVAPEQTPAPVQEISPVANQSSQVPVQILQVAWFLTALLNANPGANAGLIQQIQQSPIGQFRYLRNDRVDHASLATLSAELGILANMLSQHQAAGQEIAEFSNDDDDT